MNPPENFKVTIRHEVTGQARVCVFNNFDVGSPTAVLHCGPLVGIREFSLNHGYGKALPTSKEAPIRMWRIDDADLEQLRTMARAAGKKVKPCGKSPGSPKQPKRGKPAHARQLHFGSVK